MKTRGVRYLACIALTAFAPGWAAGTAAPHRGRAPSLPPADAAPPWHAPPSPGQRRQLAG
eukprot:294194-Chlamydomonas_euryale.AAC.4